MTTRRSKGLGAAPSKARFKSARQPACCARELRPLRLNTLGAQGMPEQAIRFCVSDSNGLRSASWKCWTPTGKEDVYLTCRELNGAIKASLHQSGSWHSAYDSTFFDNAVRHEDRTDTGRFVDRWHTPTPLAPGVLLAFRIVTPWGSVFTSQPDMPGLFSAPKPAKGCAIEFDLFIRPHDLCV